MRSFLIPSLVSVFLLSACTFGQTDSVVETPHNSYSGISQTISEDSGFNSCITVATTDCSKQFISAKAGAAQDASVCTGFSDAGLRSICVSTITTELAKRAGKPEICNSLGSEKVTCIAGVIQDQGRKTGNVDVCEQISRDEVAGTGQTLVERKDRCRIEILSQIPVTDTTLTQCAKIENQEARQSCERTTEDRINFLKANPMIPSVFSHPLQTGEQIEKLQSAEQPTGPVIQ